MFPQLQTEGIMLSCYEKDHIEIEIKLNRLGLYVISM